MYAGISFEAPMTRDQAEQLATLMQEARPSRPTGVLKALLEFDDGRGRLVAVWQTDPDRKKQAILSANWDRVPLDYTDFTNWRAKQTSCGGQGRRS